MHISTLHHQKLSSLDTYYVPTPTSLSDIRAYIRTLPLEENPKIFGLVCSFLYFSTVRKLYEDGLHPN